MSLAATDHHAADTLQCADDPGQGGQTEPAAIDLDLYTDAVSMGTLLQQQLPGFAQGRLRIDALAVSSVRRNTSLQRKPSPMTLCYELQVSDAANQRNGSQRLMAQVFRPGLSTVAYGQCDRSRLIAPAFGEPLVHLPALHLLLWALPNDPGLPQLALLLDPAQVAACLPAQLVDGLASACAPKIELLRYTPGRRATLRVDTGRRTLYGKTFFDHRAQDIHARFDWFWQRAQRDGRAPLVAEPLGHDARTQTVWQAAATGVPLKMRLAGGLGVPLMGRVASALAVLHEAPLAPSATTAVRSVDHWLAEVRRRQSKIARIDATLAARAQAVAEAIHAHAAHPATRAPSLIHGDWHPDQVWVHEGRVVLFDFDEFALGDPMEDLAEFVLKLEPYRDAAALSAALIEHYAAIAPARFDARSLAWHLAIQSLLQVSRAFIFQQPGWAAELEQRLCAAEARAAALGSTPFGLGLSKPCDKLRAYGSNSSGQGCA